MNSTSEWMDERLAERLEVLRKTAPRDPAAAQSGRAAFLAEAARVRADRPRQHSGISFRLPRVGPIFPQWRVLSPALIISSLLVVVMAAFVAILPVAYAAQSSLPGDRLYGVKLLVEEARLELENGAQAKLEMVLGLADLRIAEMQSLKDQGRLIPEQAVDRLAARLDESLNLTAVLDEGQFEAQRSLMQLRLENQLRALQRVQAGEPSGDTVIFRAMEAIRTRLAWLVDAQANPQQFRQQIQQRAPWDRPPEVPGGVGPWQGGTPTVRLVSTANARPTATPKPVTATPAYRKQGTGAGQPTGTNAGTPRAGQTATAAGYSTGTAQPAQPTGGQGPGPATSPQPQGTQVGGGPQATAEPHNGGPQATPKPPGGGNQP